MQISACLLLLGILVSGQTLPDPRRCVAGSNITAFPACSSWYEGFSTCSAFAAASKAFSYYNCYCAQSFLNNVIRFVPSAVNVAKA
jgi:hypothetical protein